MVMFPMKKFCTGKLLIESLRIYTYNELFKFGVSLVYSNASCQFLALGFLTSMVGGQNMSLPLRALLEGHE